MEEDGVTRPCPTPGKLAYETRAQADKVVNASLAMGLRMRAYPCPCGAYHLTSKQGAGSPRVCAYGPCARLFSPIDGARYCSPAHAKKAHEKRRLARRREELNSDAWRKTG